MNTAGLDSNAFSAVGEMSKPQYLFLYNVETRASRWMRDAVDYFGLPDEYIERVDELWPELVHPDDREVFLQEMKQVLTGEKSEHSLQYRVKNKKGHYVVCRCRGRIIPADGVHPPLLMGLIDNHGITGNVDPMTQLFNIYEFRKAMHQLQQSEQNALVMIVGLNQHSMVNSVYGYAFGSKVLREFGQMLKSAVGSRGVVYRMDGAKFSLRIPQGTEEEARVLYAKIQQEARESIVVDGQHIPLGVSGGAMLIEGDVGRDACIRANITYAQEKSKRERHSELVFFRQGRDGCTTVEMVKRNEAIRRSVLDGCEGFYLCYQPLVNAHTGRIKGAEALLRWHSDTYGEPGPGEFIQWLEQDDCFLVLGNWILRQAMTDTLPLVKMQPDFILSVNVTYSQVDRSDFQDSLMEILQQTGFPPENLYIELTERESPYDIVQLRKKLEYFSDQGIKIALDDFGTGSASLNLLRQLPIDRLKIDRQFVAHIQANRVDEVIVETVIDSANKLGISVCMEGIETEQLRDYVQRYDVDTLQGYYYSRPVRMEAFRTLMGA